MKIELTDKEYADIESVVFASKKWEVLAKLHRAKVIAVQEGLLESKEDKSFFHPAAKWFKK